MLARPWNAVVYPRLGDTLIESPRGLHGHRQTQRSAIYILYKVLVEKVLFLILNLIKMYIVRGESYFVKNPKPR